MTIYTDMKGKFKGAALSPQSLPDDVFQAVAYKFKLTTGKIDGVCLSDRALVTFCPAIAAKVDAYIDSMKSAIDVQKFADRCFTKVGDAIIAHVLRSDDQPKHLVDIASDIYGGKWDSHLTKHTKAGHRYILIRLSDTITVPADYAGLVIGRKGAHIKSSSDLFGRKIHVVVS